MDILQKAALLHTKQVKETYRVLERLGWLLQYIGIEMFLQTLLSSTSKAWLPVIQKD